MIDGYLRASADAILALPAPAIGAAADVLAAAFAKGNKLLLCGNGGSAADAAHLAGEFVGRFQTERRPLPAMALADSTPAMTAIANDYGYDEVFARQVRAYGEPGDVLWCLSTSGRSRNVTRAAEAALERRMGVVAFVGAGAGGALRSLAGIVIAAGDTTPLSQQAHMVAGHLICALVEAGLNG